MFGRVVIGSRRFLSRSMRAETGLWLSGAKVSRLLQPAQLLNTPHAMRIPSDPSGADAQASTASLRIAAAGGCVGDCAARGRERLRSVGLARARPRIQRLLQADRPVTRASSYPLPRGSAIALAGSCATPTASTPTATATESASRRSSRSGARHRSSHTRRPQGLRHALRRVESPALPARNGDRGRQGLAERALLGLRQGQVPSVESVNRLGPVLKYYR